MNRISPDSIPSLVSVVVPVYNREQYVARTLTGVWEQSYRPIELVVVDDGSTDVSAVVVESWMANHTEDSQFTVQLIKQENQGVAAARNTGFNATSGEFIHFLDSDDVPLPVMYERQVAVLEHDPECGYVWSGWSAAHDGELEQTIEHVMGTDAAISSGQRVYTMPYLVWPGLFRRTACLSIGDWNESLYYNEDWEYSSRFLCLEPVIRQLPNTMMVYRDYPGMERVTARAAQHKANAAKLHTIAAIEGMIPESSGFRRTVVMRLAMMCYSALLHASQQNYKDQRRVCWQKCFGLLWRYHFLIPLQWRVKLALLCILAPFGNAALVTSLHSLAGKLREAARVSSSQWFE